VHLAKGCDSVFDFVREAQAVASSIALSQPATADTCTSRDFKFIQHKGYLVEVARLTSGVQEMLKVLKGKMFGLTGGKPVQYHIPENHVDDLSSLARGVSWMDKCYTEPREQGLMYTMLQGGHWNLCVEGVGSRRLDWNMVACHQFMDQAAEIVDLIITLVHIGAGPPVRGEEIVRDRITNGNQIRTIYLCFGQMLAIRRRSKDTNSRGVDAFNVCYFPQCLTDVICYYLLVIRPLERLVVWELYRDRERCLDYDLHLYVKHGKRMTSDQFSDTLRKLTTNFFGVKLSISPLRHIMIAFMRAFMEPKMVEKGNNIGDLMSSHTTFTAVHSYAREINNLEGVTSGIMLDVQDFCEDFHDVIGLGERTGPLMPVRFKRRLAHKLIGLASMDPSDLGALSTVGEILNRLGETAYRAALQELRSHVAKEIWEAVAAGLERVIADAGLWERLLPSNSHPQPGPPTEPPQAPPALRTLPAPTNMPPVQRSTKRQLSGKAEPAPKRPVLTSGTPRTRSDSGTVYPQREESPELEYASDDPATPTDTPAVLRETHRALASPNDPATPTDTPAILREAHPALASPDEFGFCRRSMKDAPNAAPDPPDRPIVQQLSTMTLNPPPRAPAPSKEARPSQACDLLSALRQYRRDPLAEFIGKQKELLGSVMGGSHTVAVLPTGSGKSVAYELQPTCSRQITVVAIPYKVIVGQVLENVKAHGVRAELWYLSTPRVIEDDVRLIVVPYETLLTEAFCM